MSGTIITHTDTGEKWTVGETVKSSEYSSVFLLTSEKDSNTTHIGKVANKKNKKARDCLEKEIEIHKTLKHDNIVEIIACFETANHFIIIQSYYEAGDLERLLKIRKKIKEVECKDLFKQVLYGLKYLKDNNIVHRDMKPANVFLRINQNKMQHSFDSDEDDDPIFIYDAKIGDFGFATTVDDSYCIKELGTPNFIAPEMIGKNGTEYDPDAKIPEKLFKIDIWSTGTMFFTCLVGIAPFQTKKFATTYQKIMTCDWKFPEDLILADETKSFIGKMIKLESNDRFSVEKLLDDSFFLEKLITKPIETSN